MSIKVDSTYSAFFSISSVRDSEWQKIIDVLWNKYGIRSTGSKDGDKAKLHELELKEAEQLGGNSNTCYITLSKAEIDKIKQKKKEKDIERHPEKYPDSRKGAEILGQQIFISLQLKNEDDIRENKKKRDNKYQT